MVARKNGRLTRSEEIPESGTVTVGCNIPTGLVIRLYDFEDTQINVLGGGVKVVKEAHARADQEVVLFGPKTEKGKTPKTLVVGGYALTRRVDAQFMKEWFKQNEKSPLVMNKCVWVMEDWDSAQDFAEENASRKSGLEPLTQDGKDPRLPKNLRGKITKADDRPRP